MGDQGQNPFEQFSEDDRKHIQRQLTFLHDSGKLNPKQQDSVRKALSSYFPQTPGTGSMRDADRGIVDKTAAFLGVKKPKLAENVGQGAINRLQFESVAPRRYAEESGAKGGPALSFNEFLPNKQATNPTPVGSAFKAVGDVASGFTSPDNLGIMLATAGLGEVTVPGARALAKVPGLGRLAANGLTGGKLITAYFTGQMGKDLVKQVPEIGDRYQEWKKDPSQENLNSLVYGIASAGAQGIVAGLGVKHLRGEGAAKTPKIVSLSMAGEMEKLGWSPDEIMAVRPQDAKKIIDEKIRRENFKPEDFPSMKHEPEQTTALAIRPKPIEAGADPSLVEGQLKPPKGDAKATLQMQKKGLLKPVPKPPEEMGPPALVSGETKPAVPILQGGKAEPEGLVTGGRSPYIPGVPAELQGQAHWLDEKKAELEQEADRARKQGDEEAARAAERKLKVVDRRRVALSPSETTPVKADSGPAGVPEVPKPPDTPTDAQKSQQEPSKEPPSGSDSPANPLFAPTETGGATNSGVEPEASPSPQAEKSGRFYRMLKSAITFAPDKLQFRQNERNGLADVKKFNPNRAGVIQVWHNPADGKTYVVNGHHRLDLAMRDPDASHVDVEFINARDFADARVQGALQNISEGSADPLDAAKIFRETGITPEVLQQEGVSLSGNVAGDGMAIARLSPKLFSQVVSGDLPTSRAVAIGKYLSDPAEQEGLAQLIEQKGRGGERLRNDEIEALARFVKNQGTTSTEEPTLFGTQTITQSNAVEHAQLEAYIKRRLSKDKRLFGYVSKSARADELKRAGNIINVDKSTQIAEAAKISEEVFNRLIDKAGPLSNALTEGAKRIAAGEESNSVRNETYQKAIDSISEALGKRPEESGPKGSKGPPKTGGTPNESQAPITTFESLSGGRKQKQYVKTDLPPVPKPPGESVLPDDAPTTHEESASDQPGTLRTFADKTVAPTAREAAANFVASASWLKRTFAPELIDKFSRLMAGNIRHNWAWLENERTRTHKAFKEFRDMFDEMPEQARLKWMMDFEAGKKFPDPKLQAAADLWRRMQDSTWREVQKRNGIETYIQNFLPHYWENPETAGETYGRIYSKKSLAGPKEFEKARSIPTLKDGLDAGLKLVETNPVKMMEAKLHSMRHFIAGYDIMREAEDNGMVMNVSVYKSPKQVPEGWTKIEGPMGTIWGRPGITVKEAYDMHMMDQLNEFARSLGIKHFRKTTLPGGALGYTTWPGDEVFTRMATPLGTLTHEIGHQLDFRYGLGQQMVNNPEFKAELRALADERYRGKDEVSNNYKKYVRNRHEKMANLVDAIINTPDLVDQVAPKSAAFLRNFMQQHDELRPFLDIKPSLTRDQAEYNIRTPGIPVIGYRYMPTAAATILNNHLSRGLRETSPLFKGYLGFSNNMNRFQLGWSLYHFTFTGVESSVSKAALGIKQVLAGDVAKGSSNIVKGVIPGMAAIENYRKGSAYMKMLLDTNPGSEINRMALEELNRGGGRLQMDSFYSNSSVESFWNALRGGNKIAAAWHAPFALVEEVSKPIMEDWVPKLKLGVYFEMAQHELSKLPENADVFQQREALGKAWNSVDNRLGQLVYDNLFWNKALKDLGMASVRSLGWNLGSIREFGGGAVDLAKGKITHKAAYALALPVVIGLQGAMLQYALTGKGPDELKDYYFPKTGKTNPDGSQARLTMASYFKDLYNYLEGFRYGVGEGLSGVTRTVSNKLNPGIGFVIDMLNNQDFYGVKIRNERDPLVKQLKDMAEYAGSQFVPISARNVMEESRRTGESPFSAEGVRNFFGLVPAPRSVDRTKAEYLANKYTAEEFGHRSRSKEDFEKGQLKGEFIRRMKLKDAGALNDLQQAVKDGKLSYDDRAKVLDRARHSALEAQFIHMSIEDAIDVYEAANDKEREGLKPLLLSKAMNTRKLSPENWVKMRERVMKLIGQQGQSTSGSGLHTTFTSLPPVPPPPTQ